ncbi:hypothetical protein AB4452_04730 [Vibrio lentus]
MKVQLPNGVIIEGVPEGASRDEIKETAIRNGLATPQDFFEAEGLPSYRSDISQYPEHIQEAMTEPFGSGDAVRAATQGATFGFGEEMEAGLNAVSDLVTGKGWTYSEWRDAFRDRMDAYSDENPWTSTGLEVAGSVPTALVAPAVKGFDWANKGRSSLKLAGEGAAYGGLYGLGSSEGETVGDIASDTGKGATIGGVTGPVTGAALSGLGKLFTRDNVTAQLNKEMGIGSTFKELYPTAGKSQDLLDLTSGGAFAASQRSMQYQNEAKEALRKLSEGKGNAKEIGERFINVKDDWQGVRQEYFKIQFNKLRDDIDMQGETFPTATYMFLRSEREAFGGAEGIADIVEIPAIKRLRKAMIDGEDLTVDTLWKLRQEVGDSISTGKFGTDDISQGKAKQLYSVISDDLEEAVYQNTNLATARQFSVIDDQYSEFKNTLKELQPIFAKSNREPHSPEKVTAELVKRFRDEPSSLAELREITNISGSPFIDDAAAGVLYQTALNRGQVDPTKALERYDISRSKQTDITGDTPVMSSYQLTSTSPAKALTQDSVEDYEKAIRLSRRSQDALERGNAAEAKQLVLSGAVPALAGFALGGPIGSVLTPIAINAVTYGLRRGMSNEAASAFADKMIKGIQDGSITADQLRIFNTIMAADSEAFSEFNLNIN